MSCIFCRIAAREIPTTLLHEDEHTASFLDIQPLKRGHILVIPRVHIQYYEDLPSEVMAALGQATARLSRAVRVAVGAEATTLAINNGPAAGQEVPHCHLHIIPRDPGDIGGPIHALFPGAAGGAEDLDAVAAAIQEALA
jgi:histidine triad (HIT) family protein